MKGGPSFKTFVGLDEEGVPSNALDIELLPRLSLRVLKHYGLAYSHICCSKAAREQAVCL